MNPTSKQSRIAVIGGGPAGLMAAEVLAQGGASVTVFDRMPSVARKFLMAGRGGLNLTHSEPFEKFLSRYSEGAGRLQAPIEHFTPAALRAWCEALGQPTFVGTSGRIFPRSMKASPVLRAWLLRLQRDGVEFALRHRWIGWSATGAIEFDTPGGNTSFEVDATVLALGGASWPRLGSDGDWCALLDKKQVTISPLRASNCGFMVAWTATFRERFSGEPLKTIALTVDGHRVRGEAVITDNGIEGGAVYALSARLRDAINAKGRADVRIDLRPDTDRTALTTKLSAARARQSLANFLRKAAGLSPVAIGLLRECTLAQRIDLAALQPAELATLIKSAPVMLTGVAPIDRAISTAGGIRFNELDENLMLRRLPGVFAAGEMLDWDAPTGGYLLQAVFATGAAAGRGALSYLANEDR